MDAKVSGEAAGEGGGLRTRWVELVVALLIMLGGGVVIFDSVRIGAQWASDGPQAGYFPWLAGSALALCGGWLAAVTIARWKTIGDEVFVSWAKLNPVLSMLVPSIVYVGLIYALGIYAASAIFIAFFMLWKGKFGWLKTLAVSLSVPTVLFMMFEVWFLVPLPKGPVERLLGY